MQIPSLLQNKQPGGSSGTGPARFPSFAVSSPGPDADINSNAGLLDVRADGDHFTYGQYNKPGSQSAQNAVPHLVQRMCRPLLLPHSKRVSYGNVPFALPRPHLQRGELAFCMRVGLESRIFDLCSRKDMIRHKAGSASDALINLHTLNYILRGIQVHKNKEEGWHKTLWNDFSMETVVGVWGMNMEDDRVIEAACTHVVSNCIRPFGIVKADEMKGSQNEVVSLIIDGYAQGVNNYWLSSSLYKDNPSKRKRDDNFINSGDSLILILKWLDVSNEDPAKDLSYVLPTPLHPNGVRMNFEDTPKKRIMQLVPSVESMNCKECWERLGYWKIGVCNSAFQTADPQDKRDPKISIQSESASCIDMRFAPVWTSGYKNTDDTGSWRDVRNHDDGIIALPPPKKSPPVVKTGLGATQEPWKTIMIGQGWITEMEQKSAELQARGETLALSDQLILDAGLLSEKIYQACKEHSENALGTMKKIAIVNRSLRDALDAISRNTDEASSNARRIVDRLVDIMALATSTPVVAGVEFDFNDVEMKNHIWDLPDILNSQIKDMITEALMLADRDGKVDIFIFNFALSVEALANAARDVRKIVGFYCESIRNIKAELGLWMEGDGSLHIKNLSHIASLVEACLG